MTQYRPYENCVLQFHRAIAHISPGNYRVLRATVEHLLIITMEEAAELAKRKTRTDRRKVYYHPAPVLIPTDRVLAGMGVQPPEAEVIAYEPPTVFRMSDAEIVKHVEIENGVEYKFSEAQLQERDATLALIDPLLLALPDEKLLEPRAIARWISANGLRKKKTRILHAVHRYLAAGRQKNVLLGNKRLCGAPGRSRIPEPSDVTETSNFQRPGRPDALEKAGKRERYRCNSEDVEQLQAGWAMFSKRMSLEDAHIRTAWTFYSKLVDTPSGGRKRVLLPDNERPTKASFRYHGEKIDAKKLKQARMTESEYQKRYRGLAHKMDDGLSMVGSFGFLDSTGCKVNLVSTNSRVKVVSPAHRTVLQEGSIPGLLMGWSIGFHSIDAEIVKSVLASAALPKEELFDRYEIDMSDLGPYPCVYYRRLLADNGEARNFEMTAKAELEQMDIRWIPTGRSDLNGSVEAGHGAIHRRYDYQCPATNFGRQKKRGEDHPALFAKLNLFEYIRGFLWHVQWKTYFEPVPELRTAEMVRMKVAPYRYDIFQFMVDNGYIERFEITEAEIRASLYQKWPAILKSDGIHLLRDDSGNKREYIQDGRFSSKMLRDSGHLELARVTDKGVPITVRIESSTPDAVWFAVAGKGLVRIPNASIERIVLNEMSLVDMMAEQDQTHLDSLNRRGADEQHKAEELAARDEIHEHADKEKKAELKALKEETGKAPSKKEQTAGRRDNRQEEKELQGRQISNAPVPLRIASPPPVLLEMLDDDDDPVASLALANLQLTAKVGI